ncbi:DUF6428 family protein [Sinorhizobium fredii]|nr:DUF6428 family protein [Sinorhizobium fredii]
MSALDNTKIHNDDISLGLLLETLAAASELPLVFHYDGRPIKAGYHVTEVKAGQFAGLDCGANPEAWTEIFVQLWDVEEDSRAHMPAGKFSGIIGKVSDHLQLAQSAKLTFEVSDGVRPMQLYCASLPRLRDNAVHVELAPRPASCKPRDRWLAEEGRASAACCAPVSSKSACCA